MDGIGASNLDRYLVDPVSFVAEQLVLEDGRTYGEAWEPFQEALFRAIFAVTPEGRPRYRLLYDERRRGESKTEDAAAAAIADLVTGPDRHRSYAVAGDEDQAALVLDSVSGFIARSPFLGGLDVQRSVVRNVDTGSELRVMSSDSATAYGLRVRRVIFDELSLQRDERLWTAMWTAVGKRADAQMVALSMAGWDFASLGWRVREAARTTQAYYFATRDGSLPAPWLSPTAMEEQRETLHPADFARLWECRWTEPKGSWITREMYDAAERGTEHAQTDGSSRYAGFVDVGLVHDATAVAVCHLAGETVVLDALHTLRGTRNQPVQLDDLEELVLDLDRRFGVAQWIFEAPQAVASVQRLQGRGVAVEARYPTAETQARLFGTLYSLFARGQLIVFRHEELRREALNLVTKLVGGRIKVVDSGAIHQDHVIALGGAAGILMDRPTRRKMRFVGQDDVEPSFVGVSVQTVRVDLKDVAAAGLEVICRESLAGPFTEVVR